MYDCLYARPGWLKIKRGNARNGTSNHTCISGVLVGRKRVQVARDASKCMTGGLERGAGAGNGCWWVERGCWWWKRGVNGLKTGCWWCWWVKRCYDFSLDMLLPHDWLNCFLMSNLIFPSRRYTPNPCCLLIPSLPFTCPYHALFLCLPWVHYLYKP